MSGKAVYLISGGLDSPVAAYLGVGMGWAPLFVYFDNSPFSDKNEIEKVKELVAHIGRVTGVEGEMLAVPHGADLELITGKCRRNLSCLLCKRMMYRKAEAIARERGCDAIVTGEIVGEQASQTVRNLAINSSAVEIPIVRPLLGMNKAEVEEMAKRIGTYAISAIKAEGCRASAVKARTLARREELEREEAMLPIRELTEAGVRGARQIRLH